MRKKRKQSNCKAWVNDFHCKVKQDICRKELARDAIRDAMRIQFISRVFEIVNREYLNSSRACDVDKLLTASSFE